MLSDIARYILDEALNYYEGSKKLNKNSISGTIFHKAMDEIRSTCVAANVKVILTRVGSKPIQVIKVIRAHTGMGLRESKHIIDSCQIPLDGGTRGEPHDTIIPITLDRIRAEQFVDILFEAGAEAKIVSI